MLQSLDKQADKCTLLWPDRMTLSKIKELRLINLLKYHLFLTKNLSDGI